MDRSQNNDFLMGKNILTLVLKWFLNKTESQTIKIRQKNRIFLGGDLKFNSNMKRKKRANE